MAELFPKTILFVCLVALSSSASQTTTMTSRGATDADAFNTVTSRGATAADAFNTVTSRGAMDTDATENIIISTQRKEFPKDMTSSSLGSPRPIEGDGTTLEDIEALINDNSDFETCNCPDLATTGICNCTALQGKIVNSDVSLSNPDLTYNLDVGGNTSIVIVYFKKEDLTIMTGYCEYTIGNNHYDSESLMTMKDDNIITTDGVTPITALIKAYSYCKYVLYYFAFPLHQTVISLNETEGELTPFQDDPDQTVFYLTNTTEGELTFQNDTGEHGYPQNTQILWVIEPELEGQLVTQFNLTINKLDLGAPTHDIHDADKINETKGDFLLIGPGDDVLGGSDIMFFGQNEEVEPQRVISIGKVAHVFFYSSFSMLNGTGFNISWMANVVDDLITQSTTTTEKPPGDLEYIVVAINGILSDKSEIDETINSFKEMMVNMSTEYVKQRNCSLKENITSSMIEVYETRTCNSIFCDVCCVAFNFSVAAEDEDGQYIFTNKTLDDMVNDKGLEKDFIKRLEDDKCTSSEGCKVCDEHPSRTMWMYIVVPVVVVVFAVIVSITVWILSYKDHAEDVRKKYEKEMKDRQDDNRRRSSGDVSILGLGGSIASRGSISSRRFTMPFPKTKKDDDIQEEDEDGIDMTDFKEYDPDFGRVDPAEFGLHRELLDNRNAVRHYTNEAFEDDDEHERTVFHRQHQQHTAMAAGTDSDDSDREAVIFSEPTSMKSKKKTVDMSLTATVDVHRSDDDSLQRMNISGETAL